MRSDLGRELVSAAEDVGRTPYAGRLSVPSGVALDKGRIVWSEASVPGTVDAISTIYASGRLLLDFTRLYEGPDADIETFARRYGPLRLCAHHEPHTHLLGGPLAWSEGVASSEQPGVGLPCPLLSVQNPDLDLADATWVALKQGRASSDELLARRSPVFWEAIGDWRHWSQTLSFVLSLAEKLRNGQRGYLGTWHWLGVGGKNPPSVEDGRAELSYRVNSWLEAALVRPWVRWRFGRSPGIVFGGGITNLESGGELFGRLAWDVTTALGRTDQRLVTCSGCGNPYTPLRLPGATGHHYCPSCRRSGVPERERKRRQRDRRKP